MKIKFTFVLLLLLVVISAGAWYLLSPDRLTATVTSYPTGSAVTFHGIPVGKAPVDLILPSLDHAVEVSLADEGTLVERRVKVLGRNRVEIFLRSGDPSPTAAALGLTRVVVFDYGARASFETNSADLKPEFLPMLQRQAEVLQRDFEGLDVYVCGHTDSTGQRRVNEILSLRRAEAVTDYLVSLGLDRHRLRAMGLGSDYPLQPNDTEEGRGMNRRTEIMLAD